MAEASTDRPKRPYLRPAERRRHLLDAAAAVVRRDGLNGLTMVAVTAEAGVSRRLVYNHFPDLRTLVGAYVTDRLSAFAQESDATFIENVGNPLKVAREIFTRILAIAPEDRSLLRAILCGAVPREILPIQAIVEQVAVDRWERVVPENQRQPLDRVRWLALIQVGLTLVDGMDRGFLTAPEADIVLKDALKLVPHGSS